MLNHIKASVSVLLVAVSLSACTYRGGDIGDPAVRKFHWYSFIDGDDIKAGCAPGTPDRFRLVYNALYSQQIRIYQLDSLQKILSAKVVGGGNAAKLDPNDLLAPWRAEDSKMQLDDKTYDHLVQSFRADKMFGEPAVGLRLPSESYYWTAASCVDGRYHFTAWKHPSNSFDSLSFTGNLFALDMSGVAVRKAGPIPFDAQRHASVRTGEVVDFTLEVGASGLNR